MRAYRMPDWLHSSLEAAMAWALQDIRQGRPMRAHRTLALKIIARTMALLLVVGVWGRPHGDR